MLRIVFELIILSFLTVNDCNRGGNVKESSMGQQSRVSNVLRGIFGRSWKYMEIPLHCLRKRRWCIPGAIHYRTVHYWKTDLLHGDDIRTI